MSRDKCQAQERESSESSVFLREVYRELSTERLVAGCGEANGVDSERRTWVRRDARQGDTQGLTLGFRGSPLRGTVEYSDLTTL